jgi:hypothetical protein
MNRAKFYFNTTRLPLGPASIESSEPEYGLFKPGFGKPVYFTNEWVSPSGIKMNIIDSAIWPLVQSGTSLYNTLASFTRGTKMGFSGFYGAYYNSGLNYRIEIIDSTISHLEGLTLKGNKTAYSITLKWNRVLI